MVGSGRIVGLILMVVSAVLLLVFGVWMFTAEITPDGRVFGLLLSLLVLAPIFAVGLYLMRQGTVEQKQYANVTQEKKLLNMVKHQLYK